MNRKTLFGAVLLVVCVLAGQSSANAGCNGGNWGWLFGCGGQWDIHERQSWLGMPEHIVTVTNHTIGCYTPNDVPDEASCSIEAGSIEVIDWNVTGELTVGILNGLGVSLGGSVGQTVTRSYSAQVGNTLKNFCRTCWNTTWFDRNVDWYMLRCSCGSAYSLSGTVERLGTQRVQGGMAFMEYYPWGTPCNPNCPDE